MFPIFMGAFAFAMFSATWLIHARRQLKQDHLQLALEHSDLRTRFERAQALLDVPDQRIVIWNGEGVAPVCHGALPANVHAPIEDADFIAFGNWMSPLSAQSFDEAVDRLRSRAEAFDLSIETRSGTMVEAQGRASGSHAFVRFISLAGDRAALASLENQHTRLVETTDTMQALLQSLSFPAWMRDASGQLKWANRAFIDAVGQETPEAANAHNSHLFDQPQRDRICAGREPVDDEETPAGTQRFRDRMPATIAGDRRLMDVTEISHSSGSAGIAVDISEVEEVEAKLRRTLESHAQTVNLLATAVAIFDSKRKLTFHNEAFEKLWSLPAQALDNEPDNGQLFDMLRDEGKLAEQPDWSKWRNGLLEVYEATQPTEHWWHLPDGRTLRVAANPHKQGGVTWVFENVTEQLEMESRYIALTQVQGETLDHLGEAIAVFAPNGHLKLSNPSFQTLWELEDEQVAAETPISAIGDHCRTAMEEQQVWDDLITGVTGVSDLRRSASGRTTLRSGAVLDYALVPLPNGQTMLSFADVSANVRLEHTLKERNEALETAEKLKNDFIEHVSYEFRSPLTNIKGFAEMLDSRTFGALNEKQAEYVGHIASSSNVLHSLVDNLLDLATVDAGIMELDLQDLKLTEAMATAARSVGEQLKEKGVKMHVVQPKGGASASFVADANRVQQVLFNLLNNAVKFSPEGSTVKLESGLEGSEVFFRVRDAGPGIPADDSDMIFERFNSKAQGGGLRGTGLGLSIAHSLVHLHGGTLDLEQDGAPGACFVCRFPIAPQIDLDAASVAAE